MLLTTFLVTVPTVVVAVASPQTVGSSLKLTCSVTTVQGVTTMANITWTANGVVLQMTTDRIDNVPVYINNYTISTLSTSDDGRIYQCEVVVLNTSLSTIVNDNVTLSVICKCVLCYSILFMSYVSSSAVPIPIVTLLPSGPIQGAMVGSPQMIQCAVSSQWSGVQFSNDQLDRTWRRHYYK